MFLRVFFVYLQLCFRCGHFGVCCFNCAERDLLTVSGFGLSAFLQFLLISYVVFFSIQQELETGDSK